MKRYLFTLFSIICFTVQTMAQNFKAQLADLKTNKDTAAQTRLLAEWEKTEPENPDLYIAYFNYYVVKSQSEVLNLGTQQAGGNSLELTDPKTKQVVGFLNSGGISYDRKLIDKSLYYIDAGINKFPQRLDMRFGKIYILGEINNHDEFTREIITTIDHAVKINLKWTWADNKALDDAKNFMLGNIQSYVEKLYNGSHTAIGLHFWNKTYSR